MVTSIETTETSIMILDENKAMAWPPVRKQSLFQSTALQEFCNSNMLSESEYTVTDRTENSVEQNIGNISV